MNDSITDDIVRDDYIMDIYTYMKQKHGNDLIILFHVGSYFESYMDDSVIIADILNRPRVLLEKHYDYVVYVTRIAEDKLEECMNVLLDAGIGVVVSEMRGRDGRHKLDCL